MFETTFLILSFCLIGITISSSPVSAEDACLAGVRTALDAIEREIPALKKGDGTTANELIKKTNAVKAKLGSCDRTKPDWADLARRANDLDAKVRAQASGQDVPGDEWTPKAAAELELIEQEVAAQKPGDAAATNGIVLRLNAVRDLLRKSKDRSQQAWKDAVAQTDALDRRARARYAESPVASGEGPSVGSTVPMLPSDLGKGLAIDDKHIFTSEFEPAFKDCARMLNDADARLWADDGQASKVTTAIERMRKTLARIKNQAHPGVQHAYAAAAEVERVFVDRQTEGKRVVAEEQAEANAEAADVDTQLAGIESFFNPATFSCKLEPPFTSERVHEWILQLKEYGQLEQKGLNLLDKVVKEHPDYTQNQRVKSLRHWFSEAMPKRLAKDIGLTTEHYQDGPSGYQGKMAFFVERARRYLAPGIITQEKLSMDGWVDDKVTETELGAQAADALVQFYRDYHGKENDTYRKASAECHTLLDRLQTGAAKAMANVEMPPAKSNDANLLQVAKDVVKNAGAGAYDRMVINYGPTHKLEKKSEAKIDGNYLRIWHWTEEWDEFQVTLAERFETSPFGPSRVSGAPTKQDSDPHHRLVSYTLKRLSHGPSWKRLNAWVCSDRIVGKKILEENIQK